MSLPPIKRLWHRCPPKRACQNCGGVLGQVKELNWAHIIGRAHDPIIFTGDWQDPNDPFAGSMFVRLAEVHEDDIVVLCGPATETGTCHQLYDAHRLDIWDLLTDAQKERAKKNAGTLGLAMRRCAPLTCDSRLEIVDGVVLEAAA